MTTIIQPKITCLHYLTIGNKFDYMKTFIRILNFSRISIGIITLTFSSCDGGHQIDYNLTTTFRYINLTDESVELQLFNNTNTNFKNYSIPVGSEISISLKQDGGKTGLGTPFGFKDNYASTVTIKFNLSNKCLANYPNIKNVKGYDNFSESMYNTSNNTLIYNIDSEEMNLATPCQ
jgi:hypothetical protein